MTKTTIEISDELLQEARALAVEEQTTLRELVERGLRSVVARRGAGTSFRLRDGSVAGDGLQPEFRDAGWEKIRDTIYDVERE